MNMVIGFSNYPLQSVNEQLHDVEITSSLLREYIYIIKCLLLIYSTLFLAIYIRLTNSHLENDCSLKVPSALFINNFGLCTSIIL